MGIAYNSKIVTEGLILCLDAANAKSYPVGSPAGITLTNLIPSSTITTASLSANTSYGSITDGVVNISGEGDSSANGTYLLGIGDLATSVNSDFTTTGWLNRTTSTSGEVMSYRHSSWRCSFDIVDASMIFYQRETFGSHTTRSTSVSTTSNLNQWYYYALVRSGDNWSFYKNESLIGTNSFSLTETISGPSLYTIGIAWSDDDFQSNGMNGSIGPIMHYTRALVADEISQNFNAHRGRFGI